MTHADAKKSRIRRKMAAPWHHCTSFPIPPKNAHANRKKLPATADCAAVSCHCPFESSPCRLTLLLRCFLKMAGWTAEKKSPSCSKTLGLISCRRFHCPSPMYPNRFPKIRNTSSIFPVITTSDVLSQVESFPPSVTCIIRHFSRNGRTEPAIFLPSPIFRKKTAFVFHFHETCAFCSRIEAAIHRSFNGTKARER